MQLVHVTGLINGVALCLLYGCYSSPLTKSGSVDCTALIRI